MTTVNILEDSNNPTKYIIISSQAGTSDSVITTRVFVGSSTNNRINLLEVSRIPGDKGDKGDTGPAGPPGQDGVIFDILPIVSGGTNNTSFNADKIIYYDGTKLSSSELDINNIQNDVISNIYAGDGLSKVQDGSTVTINANLGEGLTIVDENDIGIDTNFVITKTTLDLSDTSFYQGKLPINHGGTNNTFFGLNSLVYYNGSELATYPIPTGRIVHSGHIINVEAGSGLVGGGSVTLPNGSIVLKIQNSDDIVVFDDHIELSQIIPSGTYTKVSVNDKGRVISGTNLTFTDIVSAIGGTPWTSSNDGSDSGLDADLLDGQHGSYYRNASNITGTISTDILPDIIGAGSAPKVIFSAKGLIIDSGILSYLDITDGLGYVPFDKGGGSILGDVEIFGDLVAASGFFTDNTLTIGDDANTNNIRAIKFRYNDVPAKYAVLGYYPAEDVFRISSANESSSGIILTLERADAKYVALTGMQEISGIKTFLNDIQLNARLIINSPYPNLSPFSVGDNTTLVQFLNADLLDGEHKTYYRNAINLTGTLNPYVIIPHIQERGEASYSDVNNPNAGYKEYLSMFHTPNSGHPMVLRSSNIAQTGYIIYMEDVSVSIGDNSIDNSTTNSLLVGNNNYSHSDTENSLAVGEDNFISGINSLALNFNSSAFKDNSIALGKYGETWIDDQITIGGFKNFNIGTDGTASKDAHAQVSYVPLKYHGEASSWTPILYFTLPDNKTIEYQAKLLFTKQVNTGVASFTITPGIVKNYGYRDRSRNYQAYKKATIATHHDVIENYNNSQERIYNLPLDLAFNSDTTSRSTTLEVTAAPYQYNDLDIEAYDNPIIIKNKSDFQTRLKTTRGSQDIGFPYRHEYVIKLEPYNLSPYNSGSPINLGRNIHHHTECLYYRESGSARGIIKFPNHGISQKVPIEYDNFIGTGDIRVLSHKNTTFSISIPQSINHSGTIKGLYREQNTSGILIYRNYLHQNITESLSGSFSFDVYRVSGSLTTQDSVLTPPLLANDPNNFYSDMIETITLNFSVTGLSLSNKNWSELDSENKRLSITFDNIASWTNYGITNVTGYINPTIGLLELNLGTTYPLSGPNIFLYTDTNVFPYVDYYYQPSYYLDDLSATLKISPYKFYQNISDNFEYIDRHTLGFVQKQLCYISGYKLQPISYPNNLAYRINSDLPYCLGQLILNSGSKIIVGNSSTATTITGIQIDNLNNISYLLDNSYSNDIYQVGLADTISGVGISPHKSKIITTGTYQYSNGNNSEYSQTYQTTLSFPLVPDIIPGCDPEDPEDPQYPCLYYVPTGSNLVFHFNSGIINNTSSYYDGQAWTFFGSSYKVAASSVPIVSGDQYVDIPPFVFPINSLTTINSGLGVASGYFDAFDFRINNICINRGPHPIRCSGYQDSLDSNRTPALFASGTTYRYYLPAHTGGTFSYRFLTSGTNNDSYYVPDNFRTQLSNTKPSFNNYGNVIFRFVDFGLTSNKTWHGSVGVVGSNDLGFIVNFDNFSLQSDVINKLAQGNFVADSGALSIAYATGYIYPDNVGLWSSFGISGLSAQSSGEVSISLVAQPFFDYINMSGIATTGNTNILGLTHNIIDRGLTVMNVYPKIDMVLQSATGANTGVFSVSLSNKQEYHTLNITSLTYLDYLRYIGSSDTNYIDNNLNIGFSLLNNNQSILSGVWLPDTIANKHIINKPYSKIHNIDTNNSTFSIAVLSGYIPAELSNTGLVLLSIPNIYEFDPESKTPSNHTENRISINFKSSQNILQNGIYSLIDEYEDNPYNIYIYDWSRSFITGSDFGTGIINYNNIGYNVINDKFSLWGKNFDGDIILHPWRDVPTFVSDSPGLCESGRLCIKFSGIPNYFQKDDSFWVDIIPNIYPQPTGKVYANGFFVTGLTDSNDQTFYLKCPNSNLSGIVLGMNVYGFQIPSNSYITNIISGEVITLNNTINGPISTIYYTGAHSGTPNSSQITYNQFSFDRETPSQNSETNALRQAWRTFISGDYQIYRDEIAPTVVSILTRIPPFYYESSHQYYNAWNTTQATRGVNVWRTSGSTGVSIMITGIENIQTDKDPNYGYRYLSVQPSLLINPYLTGYQINGTSNITGSLSNYRFSLDETNKYLCVTTISGLYKPTATSGILSSKIKFLEAGDWTTSETAVVENTQLIYKDIDDFSLLGINLLYGNNIREESNSSNFTTNIFTQNNLPQNSGITFRFGLIGGAGIENHPPKILVSGIESGYRVSQLYSYGLSTGLLSYQKPLTPFSNTWYIDLHIDALQNIPSFSYRIRDILGETISGTIVNSNPRQPEPYINNFTTGTYSTCITCPWVISFDLENANSTLSVGVSGGSNGDLDIISSGITYNTYLNKWQIYAFGSGVPVNDTYSNIPIGITGDVTVVYTGNLTISDSNLAFAPRITNITTPTKISNLNGDSTIIYFNYQRPVGVSTNPTIQINNEPTDSVVTTTLISDISLSAYSQATHKQLYRVTVSNVGPTGYTLNIVTSLNGVSDSTDAVVIAYDPFNILSVSVPDPLLYVGRNWTINISTEGGGGPTYLPKIQLFNAPSQYGTGNATYNYTNMGWDISLTGSYDTLLRYNTTTGTYDMGLYVTDVTRSGIPTNASVVYRALPDFVNLQELYAVKNKSYASNFNTNNFSSNDFILDNNNFSISTTFPTANTLVYKKYNPLINIYELRYSGEPPTDKWNSRITISNIDQEFSENDPAASVLSVDVRGLDTDIISVIGMLEMKEIEVISTDYPPIDIVNVVPEESETTELKQGDEWELSFDVVGGLANPNFPPTVLLSGTPSVCSGYYPDEDPEGPSCLSSLQFINNTFWRFAFTGGQVCDTGIYNISIKAFDLTGEDIAYTNILFTPLQNPSPKIRPIISSTSLYPNCLPFSGHIKIESSQRSTPCPYNTGISGWRFIGELPAGLDFVREPPSAWSLSQGNVAQITGLDPVFYTGVGGISFTGTPTSFPSDNIYDSFSFVVTGLNLKTAFTTVTLTTLGITPVETNPIGATLYFPNSGYYEAPYKEEGESVGKIRSLSQTIYSPYPSTGAMICRSSLVENECPTYITGIYSLKEFDVTGVIIADTSQTNFNITGAYGYEPDTLNVWKNGTQLNSSDFIDDASPTFILNTAANLNDVIVYSGQAATGSILYLSLGRDISVAESNVYVVFDDDLSNSYNGIYQLVDIITENSFDPETFEATIDYYADLRRLCDTSSIFDGISPGIGFIKMMPFETTTANIPDNFDLTALPKMDIGCNTCVLGDGELEVVVNPQTLTRSVKLIGTMRPSMFFSITGDHYPQVEYNSSNPCGSVANLTLVSGVSINTLPWFISAEQSEFCYSNCYESGIAYLSGVIVPAPVLELTDPQDYIYNGQSVALALRCSFGDNNTKRGYAPNYRELSTRYYIQHMNSGLYWDNNDIKFVSTKIYSDQNTSPAPPASPLSIGYNAPSLSSGAIYRIFIERESDEFPTLNVNSYPYLSAEYYWIHRANTENGTVTSFTYPGFMPISYNSGLFAPTGQYFSIPLQILGGSGLTVDEPPDITSYLSLSNSTSEVLDSLGNSHRIGAELGSFVEPGKWNISVTGDIIDMSNYLLDYNLNIEIVEHEDAPFGKTTNNIVPITFIKLPLEFTVVSNNFTPTLSYGTKWQISFNVVGGNRPPRYWSDTSAWVAQQRPIIEINGKTCNYDIVSSSYDIGTSTWSFTLYSREIITSNQVLDLLYIDKMGYSFSTSFNVNIP